MTKQDVSKIFNKAKRTLSKHSPAILIGTGIAGWAASTVLAVKSTPKALALIEEMKEEKDVDKLTVGQTVKAAWKCYIPSAVLAVTSTACLIGSNSISTKRNAALATAYKLSEQAFTTYKEKVIETLGEKKEIEVRDRIAKEQIEKKPVSTSEVIITGNGKTLFFEPVSGRYFESDVQSVKRAENNLNKQMFNHMYVSLNDFFDEIDLSHTKVGYDIGWNIEKGLIDIHFSAQMTEDDRACLALSYTTEPTYGFSSFE